MNTTVPPNSHLEPKIPVATSVSDEELIAAALRGEQSGYEQLAARYQDRLYVSIRNDLGCSELAEDVVQDAFVKAFLRLDSFKRESNFYTWLYRIALNSRRPYIRERNRNLDLERVGESVSQMWNDTDECPDRMIERSEECDQVRAAMSRLEPHHRRILVLREYEGFDYETIAEVLGIKVGTVRSRLSRARRRLKLQLDKYVRAAPSARVSVIPVQPGPANGSRSEPPSCR